MGARMQIGQYVFEDGVLQRPPRESQLLVLGRGVEAELRVAQLEADLVAARAEVDGLRARVAELEAAAEKPAPASRRKT